MPLDIPVLFLLFNRPALARQVFNQIRQAQPQQLYVAIDGPRPNHPTDADRVAQCLSLLEEVDWPCKVHRLIRDQNLGCKRAVSSAINWFFEQVEMGIILEDDCLPDLSFFSFCRENLRYHAPNPAVMHINGVNFQDGHRHGDGSYFYSKIGHVWGWASWRRAWQAYDVDLKTYPEFRNHDRINDIFSAPRVQQFWTDAFDAVVDGRLDTWDFQWCYAIWTHHGLCVSPNQNLVSNIGFGQEATHTTTQSTNIANLPLQPIGEIQHPHFLIESQAATDYTVDQFFKRPSWLAIKTERIKERLGMKTNP